MRAATWDAAWGVLFWVFGAAVGFLPIYLVASESLHHGPVATIERAYQLQYDNLLVYVLALVGLALGDAIDIATRFKRTSFAAYLAAVCGFGAFIAALGLTFSFGRVGPGLLAPYPPTYFILLVGYAFGIKLMADVLRSADIKGEGRMA